MSDIRQLTDICRIGFIKEKGDEWAWYTKEIELNEKPEYATVKMTSDGVSALYVNGEFVEAHMGRLPNRILYVEITSKLKAGKNEIKIQLGSHLYEPTARGTYRRRGSWFSCVAAEVEMHIGAQCIKVPTDASWKCEADIGMMETTVLSEVPSIEYERFWKHAAIYEEVPEKLLVPKEVVQVAGKEYEAYISNPDPKYVTPKLIREDENGLLYDFGHLVVGYTTLEYEAPEGVEINLYYDYTESVKDFEESEKQPGSIKLMAFKFATQTGNNKKLFVKRRACRYLYIKTDFSQVKIKDLKVLVSMTPAAKKGWFRCEEELLNNIWEVGKYTLWVNKHQEYESCPRVEMKFFSGDGIISALIDYYAFGYEGLVDASLSCTERSECLGTRHDAHSRNDELWDYPALRILMAYNHYIYTGDKEFLSHYYPELKQTLMWLVNKMGSDNLIYQYPVWYDGFFRASGSVEYTCSYDRIGQKTYLNALLYKSLVCMSELASVQKDFENASDWSELAEKTKEAINSVLWNEEKGAYLDLQYPDSCPQDGNALAVLFGIADERKTKLALDSLVKQNWSPYGSTIVSVEMEHTRKGKETISPLMCGYEAEARFQNGEHERALELIRRCWGTMIKKGAGTFWEFAPNHAEKRWPIPSHAWSAAPTYLLGAYVLGIRPATPGYEKLLFEPSGAMDSFEGVVPTKKGYVGVKCRVKGGQRKYTLALPKDMEIDAKLPKNADLQLVRY